RTEDGNRNILPLGALLVVEDAGAFPEDLLEGRRACLHAPAGVSAQHALDERFIRRSSRTRMEREASTRHAATVVRPTVVVVLPIAPRTMRTPSGIVRALAIARARLATVQPPGAHALHALALRRQVAAAALVRGADLTARRVVLAVFIELGVHDIKIVSTGHAAGWGFETGHAGRLGAYGTWLSTGVLVGRAADGRSDRGCIDALDLLTDARRASRAAARAVWCRDDTGSLCADGRRTDCDLPEVDRRGSESWIADGHAAVIENLLT